MNKLSTVKLFFALSLFLVSTSAFAQYPNSLVLWCNNTACEMNLGTNYASAFHYQVGSSLYVDYTLDVNSFTFDASWYLDESDPGVSSTIFKLGGFLDLFYGEWGYNTTGLCMGGSRCGRNKSLLFPGAEETGRAITKIEVVAHDKVGYRYEAALALYRGSTRIALKKVSQSASTITFNISPSNETLRLASIRQDGNTSSGDESFIKEIRIYTAEYDETPQGGGNSCNKTCEHWSSGGWPNTTYYARCPVDGQTFTDQSTGEASSRNCYSHCSSLSCD